MQALLDTIRGIKGGGYRVKARLKGCRGLGFRVRGRGVWLYEAYATGDDALALPSRRIRSAAAAFERMCT